MEFYAWEAPHIVDCDIFASATPQDLSKLHEMYPHSEINPVGFPGEYYFFINSVKKKIAPMSCLLYAFSSQYYEFPFGEEPLDFHFEKSAYEMVADDELVCRSMRENLKKTDYSSRREWQLNLLKLKIFADKWQRLFRQSSYTGAIAENRQFPAEAWEAGLVMDCGKSFHKAYSDLREAIRSKDKELLAQAFSKVKKIGVLGNLIFSQWRYYNHWAYAAPDKEDLEWFELAFARLVELIKERSGEEAESHIIGFHALQEAYGCFSNWYKVEFEYAGKVYSSVEQFMMYHKVLMARNLDLADRIMATDDPSQAKTLAGPQHFREFSKIAPIWNRYSMTIVKRGVRAKFLQHPELMAKLLLTGKALLAECAGSDTVWGIGIKINDKAWHDARAWRGDNKLGCILMTLRQEFLAMQDSGKELCYRDAREDTNLLQWDYTIAELARYPEFHDTIYAYAAALPEKLRETFLNGGTLKGWTQDMQLNMGGGMSPIGFYEMRQDVHDIAYARG